MFGLKTVKSVFSILQSQDAPWQVAAGACLGMLMGFAPFNGIQNYLILILLNFLNVNLGAAALATALSALAAVGLDPLAHKLGYALLVEAEGLQPMWTALYNMPVLPFTRFNNTVVLGSFLFALILLVPVWFGVTALLAYHRKHWKAKLDKVGIMKWMQLTRLEGVMDKKDK